MAQGTVESQCRGYCLIKFPQIFTKGFSCWVPPFTFIFGADVCMMGSFLPMQHLGKYIHVPQGNFGDRGSWLKVKESHSRKSLSYAPGTVAPIGQIFQSALDTNVINISFSGELSRIIRSEMSAQARGPHKPFRAINPFLQGMQHVRRVEGYGFLQAGKTQLLIFLIWTHHCPIPEPLQRE